MAAPGELTRRYVTNTLAQGLLKGTSALAGLWAARELVRTVGPVEFGLIGLSGALSGYMGFLGLGLPAGLVRQVADLHARNETARLVRLVRTTFVVFLVIGAAGATVLSALALAGGLRFLALPAGSEASARAAFLATAAVVLISWPLSAFSATLTGLQRIPALNAVAGLASLASAGATVAAARAGSGAAGIILAMGAVATVAGLAQAALLGRLLRERHRAAPAQAAPAAGPRVSDDLKALFSFGMWVLVLELASLLIYQTDHILLSVLVSVESITAYVIAARLHNLVREANGVLSTALFPMIAAEEARGNPAAAEQALYRGTRYSAALIAPAVLVAFLLAGGFLQVWMGAEYLWLTPWAQLFLSYFLLAVLTSFAGQVALGRGESAVLGKIAILSAAVNLVVGVALVGRFGVGGVIMGTVAAYLVGVPAQAFLLFPKLGVDLKRFLRESVLPVYGPLLPSGIVLWLLLRALPPVGGAVDLLLRATLSCVLLWIPLWWTAVEPRDRLRIRSTLALSGTPSS